MRPTLQTDARLPPCGCPGFHPACGVSCCGGRTKPHEGCIRPHEGCVSEAATLVGFNSMPWAVALTSKNLPAVALTPDTHPAETRAGEWKLTGLARSNRPGHR